MSYELEDMSSAELQDLIDEAEQELWSRSDTEDANFDLELTFCNALSNEWDLQIGKTYFAGKEKLSDMEIPVYSRIDYDKPPFIARIAFNRGLDKEDIACIADKCRRHFGIIPADPTDEFPDFTSFPVMPKLSGAQIEQ